MTTTIDVEGRLEGVLPNIRSAAETVDREGAFPADQVRSLGEAGLLGLIASPEVGGLGGGPREFVDAMLGVAGACGSTSMIYLMHLSASAVTAAAPPASGAPELLAGLASGEKLGTLAFSEKGSRSHFWAPVSQAVRQGAGVSLVAHKSWVTSATTADVYVASALAPDASGPTDSNLYVVDRTAPGVEVQGRFDGIGLRGNDSAPVHLDVELDDGARLGDEAGGFGLMMQVVLPWFCLGNSAVSLGLARSALEAAIEHASGSRFEHLDSSLADLPTIRAYLAKGWADLTAHEALLRHTADLVAAPNDQTVLAVLTSKAACNEAALRITDLAMRVAGGAGFSKHLGIERFARDARAGFVMAPTSDALFDFAGRALCGLDLF
jgi:alkylation response protein AidB-like acyl-CoA dehydrogenase